METIVWIGVLTRHCIDGNRQHRQIHVQYEEYNKKNYS